MDGNRRWAQARGLPVALGHKAGAEAARRATEAATNQGVGWLTLFAFSSENWLRPAEEVTALVGLLRFYLRSEVATLQADLAGSPRQSTRSAGTSARNRDAGLNAGAPHELRTAARDR